MFKIATVIHVIIFLICIFVHSVFVYILIM